MINSSAWRSVNHGQELVYLKVELAFSQMIGP